MTTEFTFNTKSDSDRVLERVRALLAKAESTTFVEEAASLTAKAHELIATHAIDMALIEEQHGRGDVVAIRVFIEAPYVKEKFLLLGGVARGNRCRAILGVDSDSLRDLIDSGEFPDYRNGQLATLVGYRSDLDAVELLFTSLLLQAVNVMLAHGSVVSEWGENRTKSFRRSFLIGFAYTISDRLEANQQRATDAASSASTETSSEVLPVLASRVAEVDRHVDEQFPDTSPLRTSLSNSDGLSAGQSAGRRADIGSAPISRRRRQLR